MKKIFCMIIFLLIFLYPLYSEYNYISQNSLWNIKISGYYEFYGEYFYDRRDDLFHISSFPGNSKIKASQSDRTISEYMAIPIPDDKEPNHHIILNFNTSYNNNYFTYLKFYFNSSDDIDRYNRQNPARLNQGHFRINKSHINLYMFFKEKPEQYNDPLEIFKPGKEESYMRSNPDPRRVFEWNGNECQGIQTTFKNEKHKIMVMLINAYSKWYYSYWPTFTTYYNDFWVAGSRYNYFVNKKFTFSASFLLKSWYDKSAKEDWENNWKIIAIDGSYTITPLVQLKAEMSRSFANYDEPSSRPLEKGEAYKILITGKDKLTHSTISLSYRNIGERFPTDLTLYNNNNVGVNFNATIIPFNSVTFMFYYDFEHKQNKTEDNKQEYRSELKINWINDFLTSNIKFQKILLHNYRFIWWLEHTFEDSVILHPEIKLKPIQKLSLNIWGNYTYYNQPHYDNYEPEKEYIFGSEIIYFLFERLKINVGYKFIKNKLLWNLDEHLYNLEEYSKLKEIRPKSDDIADSDYADSYGYYINDDDNTKIEGDELLHNIFWFGVEFRIFKNSFLNMFINWSKYDGGWSYWNRKIALKFSTTF